MATVPDAPNIFIRPKATDGSLEFYWQPGNSNDDAILSYTLDDGTNQTVLDSNLRYHKVIGLTNKTDYSYTLLATNGIGPGPAAAFRTVQPGLKPEQPTLVSLYRASETDAKLSWFNEAADIADVNTPTPWRNVIVAPRLINGKFAYAGDDSVTSNAKSVFGYDTSGNILVAVDASYNFIVRAANDPGYSLPYNGTGTFSLKATNYSGDSFLNYFPTGSFQNRTNYIIKKNTVGPVMNADQSAALFNDNQVAYYTANQRGFTVYARRDITYDGPLKVLDKHGFVKFSSPYVVNGDTFCKTRTNPIVPMFSQTEIYGTATSNLPFAVYDYNTNTSLISTIQEAGQQFTTAAVRNNLDNNVFISLARTGGYKNYVIEAGSKNLIFKYQGGNGQIITESAIDKEMFVIQTTPDNTKYGNILYIPNSGSPVMYDITGLNIVAIYNDPPGGYPLSSKKIVYYGSNTGDTMYSIYTFDFNGTPSYTKRNVVGIGANLFTSNSFSNFYQARTKSAVSFVDLSGSDYFAISPLITTPALQFTGTGITAYGYTSNSQYTGTLYSNDTTNHFFTGVGLNGGANTKEMTYGPFGGPYNTTSVTAFTYQNIVQTPHYSVFQFFGGSGNSIRPFILTKYNTGTNQFDVSGVDLSGGILVSSDNSGVNFVSVDTSNKSYKYSTTLWPPVEITPYMGSYYGTYPRSAYTFCIQNGTYNYYIYNGGTFDISGTVQHAVGSWIPGPDCLYAVYADGTNVFATRISTSGVAVYQTHPYTTDDSTIYGAKASTTGFMCKIYTTSTYNTRMIIDFDTTRNTFNFTLYTLNTGLPIHNVTVSTYLPNIEAV